MVGRYLQKSLGCRKNQAIQTECFEDPVKYNSQSRAGKR